MVTRKGSRPIYHSPSSARDSPPTGSPFLKTSAVQASVPETSVYPSTELHRQGGATLGGNLLFPDGHVEFPGRKLPAVIQHQNLATNLLAIP